MIRTIPAVGLVSVLALSACAVAPPSGPSVMALPPAGKSFEAFQQDDGTCRGWATQQTGGVQPAQAAADSGVGSALLATAVGAGIGAVSGHMKGGMKDEDLKELAATLDKGQAGLIVLYATNMADQVAASMLDTERTMNELQFATGLNESESDAPELLRAKAVPVRQS